MQVLTQAATSVDSAGGPELGRAHARDRAGVAYGGVLVMALLTPVIAMVVVLVAVPDGATLALPEKPIVAPVRTAEVDGDRPASGELVWVEGPAIAAPEWSGLVTEVRVRPGDEVVTGTVLAQVDGVDRLAVASPRPFHRVLAVGDRGSDVVMLRSVLAELGYPAESVGGEAVFDLALDEAVRQLESDLVPAGVRGAGRFRPEWFGWLPVGTLAVSEVLLAAGRPVPAAGEAMVVGRPTLDSLVVTVADTVHLADEPYEFVYGDVAIRLDDALSATGDAVARLVPAVAAGTDEIVGRVRLASPHLAIVVPITAVQTSLAGRQCVLREIGDGYEAVPVTVGGGGVGTAEISEGLGAGDRILVNPGRMGLGCD